MPSYPGLLDLATRQPYLLCASESFGSAIFMLLLHASVFVLVALAALHWQSQGTRGLNALLGRGKR